MFQYAPKSKFEDIKDTIETSYGAKIEDIFSHFEKEPLSSASIAQVHIATLKEGGQKVAVKVQHKWIAEDLHLDLDMLDFFIKLGHEIFPVFDFRWLSRNMKRSLPEELDFRIEAKNSENCAEMFKNDPFIKVPKVYKEHSNAKVMVMEFVEGINIDHFDELVQNGYNLEEICANLANCFTQQIFKFGAVHADPHSGNVFVRKIEHQGRQRAQLVLLDHGLYRYLTKELRTAYSYLWQGIIRRDSEMVTQAVKDIGIDEEYWALFASMVSQKDYEKVVNSEEEIDMVEHLGVESEEERRHVKDQVGNYLTEISECLRDMDPELHLIFKVNNYLKTIDMRLGKPINSVYYTAKYSFEAVEEVEYPRLGWWGKVVFRARKFYTMYCLWFLNLFMTRKVDYHRHHR